MAQSLVSVVIPSYNHGRFVVTAVQSALAQTYRNIEVIVVDDGSTDDTRERIARLGGRVKYVFQSNAGLPAARNRGIREARGEWVAFLDADDVWHPKKIELQLACTQPYPDVDVVGSPALGDMPEALSTNPPVREVTVRDFLTSTPVTGSSVMVRRRCFDVVGLFDESLQSVEDRDMWLRLASEFRTLEVAAPCWWYRQHDAQMSRRAERMLRNFNRVLTKFFTEHPQFAELRGVAFGFMYADAAKCFYDEGRCAKAIEMLCRSMVCMPFGPVDSRSRGRRMRTKLLLKFIVGVQAMRMAHAVSRAVALRAFRSNTGQQPAGNGIRCGA